MAGPILLIGCGKMGSALVAGWLERGVAPARIALVEPMPSAAAQGFAARGARLAGEVAALPKGFAPETILLAVKPQAMDEALAPLPPLLAGRPLVLSIAAGRTTGYLAARLGDQAAIVRAMPNTPAALGRGMTVLFARSGVSAEQRARAAELMEAVGQVAWIEDEAQMDAVTAVSGSGPAYVFLLVEALAEAGVAAGLPPALAMRLARATVAGAGAMLERLPQEAAALRQDVTSPGGTTAAALAVLMGDDGLQDLMRRAVAAATRRGRELAG